MGPLHETENPPDLALSWPRIQELLTVRLPAAAADPAELERIERIAVFSSGFSMQAWIDLSFLLFSFWSSVTFQALMADRSRGYLDPGRPHDVISKEVLVRAVKGLAVKFEELPEKLNIATFSRSTLFDLTPFRAKPLWVMPNGNVLCVDAALLMERLGPHVFWSVINALDTSARRKQFTSTWGLAFENYCLDAFQLVNRPFNAFATRSTVESPTPLPAHRTERLAGRPQRSAECSLEGQPAVIEFAASRAPSRLTHQVSPLPGARCATSLPSDVSIAPVVT